MHDSRLIGMTLMNSREMGSWFLGAEIRHLCLDKGYDYPRVSEEVYVNGFEEHICSRGEEVQERWRYPAHRWVVERTFAYKLSLHEICIIRRASILQGCAYDESSTPP